VHALSIAHIGIQLAVDEQYIQHHPLSGRLPEIYVFRHASFDILEYFGA
jgi:hypothetical protein